MGDNCVCKLSGMHSLRQLQKGSKDEGKQKKYEGRLEYFEKKSIYLQFIILHLIVL